MTKQSSNLTGWQIAGLDGKLLNDGPGDDPLDLASFEVIHPNDAAVAAHLLGLRSVPFLLMPIWSEAIESPSVVRLLAPSQGGVVRGGTLQVIPGPQEHSAPFQATPQAITARQDSGGGSTHEQQRPHSGAAASPQAATHVTVRVTHNKLFYVSYEDDGGEDGSVLVRTGNVQDAIMKWQRWYRDLHGISIDDPVPPPKRVFVVADSVTGVLDWFSDKCSAVEF